MTVRKETMTGRERWLAVINRQTPDRVPMDIWVTAEATENLLAHLGCDFDEALRRLHIDYPLRVEGRYIGPPLPEGEDLFGRRRRTISHGTGVYDEVVNAPLAAFETVDEIEAGYIWPNPDHWDYSHLPGQVSVQDHRVVKGGGSEPLLIYKNLRGEERAFMDLVENPDIVDYCLDKLFAFAYEGTRRIFETIPGRVDITYVSEDLGGQRALLYSPRHIRRFLLPGMKRMADLVRQHGSVVFHHSDGAIRDILPDMVDMGAQVLNPIQWQLPGMAREGLKRDFGDALIFYGGVDNQHTLPFGTVADVQREVIENFETLGRDGGYIPAPCHNIQSNTPPENVVAMYEIGYEYGWRG